MSKEETIYKELQGDDISREILEFCKSSKSTREIMTRILRYQHVKGYELLYKTEADVRDLVGIRLNKLEKLSAISYDTSENKWKTQDIALPIMQKYFGM